MPRTLHTDGFAPAMVPPGRYVDLPGRGQIFVREQPGPVGAPTIVLLHGLGATGGLNWAWCFDSLGRQYRVLTVDHRGHGHGIRTRRFRLADCADDVAALAHELGIRRLTAVGYSMGGPIAQLLWHRHRDLVDGLVFCATARNFRGDSRAYGAWSLLPFVTGAIRLTPGTVRRGVMGRVMERRMPEFAGRDWVMDELAGNDPAAVAEAAAALARYSSHDWITEVDVPTSVVITTHDRLVPPHRQRRLAESIPGARAIPIPGDHSVCVSAPRVFVPALLRAVDHATRRLT